MSDTQTLRNQIAALRLRLAEADGLARAASPAVGAQAAAVPQQLQALAQRVAEDAERDALLDSTLRQLDATLSVETAPLPARLTHRARRAIERGRDLLGRLRRIAEELAAAPAPTNETLTPLYRETAAMTETTLRMALALPDAPSTQLRLCEGLEAILNAVAQSLARLTEATARLRRHEEQIATLAELLTALASDRPPALESFQTLAEALGDEAETGEPLRFLAAPAQEPARFVACHSLTVAQVVARLIRHQSELRSRTREAVVAALLHDVGMLAVPPELLAQTGPLDDEGLRCIEAHTWIGAQWIRRLAPDALSLAEAALAHHERLDGTGYPGGLREVQVSSLTRLLAVCDVYAALCGPRPHRAAREPRTALTDTLLMAEEGALDRGHAERLLVLSFYPLGSAVELADGSLGVVVATPQGRREIVNPARPVIALVADARGQLLAAPKPLDLAQSEGRAIVRALPAEERRQLLRVKYPEWAF